MKFIFKITCKYETLLRELENDIWLQRNNKIVILVLRLVRADSQRRSFCDTRMISNSRCGARNSFTSSPVSNNGKVGLLHWERYGSSSELGQALILVHNRIVKVESMSGGQNLLICRVLSALNITSESVFNNFVKLGKGKDYLRNSETVVNQLKMKGPELLTE